MNSFSALFDWDGVVIDSSALHEKSWDLLAAETGLVLPPGHFKKGFGRKNQVIIPDILGWTNDPAGIDRLADRKEVLYRQLVREHGVVVLPGARELLAALRDAGIPRAIGSSTPRLNILTIFSATGLGEFFDGIVTADEVTHGKPDPEVFLKAAATLGADPSRCVVFEDALAGIEAAHRGGMKAVGVATTNPIEALGHADLAVHRLTEVTLDKLRGLF